MNRAHGVRYRFVRRSTGPECESGRHRYEIVHRETGRVARVVSPWADEYGVSGARLWSAYTAAPWADDEAINGTDERLEDAILHVLNPANARPPDHRGTDQNNLKPDEAGSRAKFPEAWEFYDWLVAVTKED